MRTLKEWLEHTQAVHALGVDLGLDRVKEVARRLNLLNPTCPVITIAGTNGKGSCVAGLEAVYRAQGYKVGAFTTPYLFKHNEQVRIDGDDVEDEWFCQAFTHIEAARGEITLTQFEFNTLAALYLFHQANLDVCLLEVGLGGRLDAVNIIEADLAIIASIDLDHVDWLGNTRDLIAIEKAGIMRPARPTVCGDASPPQSLQAYADEIKSRVYYQGQDYTYQQKKDTWTFRAAAQTYENLPLPSLALQNMATVLQAVELLKKRLPVKPESIIKAMRDVKLPGRIQIMPGAVTQIIDVSHNPAATQFFANKLKTLPCEGKTYAVFSMLADKDIAGSLQAIKDQVDTWFIAELAVERGASLGVLEDAFRLAGIKDVETFTDIITAYHAALDEAESGDRILVFGSFYTVAGIGELIVKPKVLS